MTLNLPVYNDRGLEAATTLMPHLEPHDTLMLVSGNGGNPLKPDWLRRAVAVLREVYPENRLVAATAGLGHIERLAESGLGVEALVYIYEPFPNVPEFSWEAEATLANVRDAAELARQGGYRAVCKPTGRPLYQAYLRKHGWHYGRLAEAVDALFVQTQTYCKGGPEAFAGALGKLSGECADCLAKVHAQVTVDPAARNGVSPEAALRCAWEALERGFAGVTLWWSPRHMEAAATFLKTLRAPDSGWR